MEPVGSVVDPEPGYVERTGQATDPVGAFEQCDFEPAAGSAPSGGEPGRPGAEDDEIL
jgi:hypothetical protein